MKDYDALKTGARIKELRLEKGFTQKTLAEMVGAAQNTIAQYECGKSKVSVEILFKLACALDISADYLLCLED